MFWELFFLHCPFSFTEPFGHLWPRRLICLFSMTQRIIWKWYLEACIRLLIRWYWLWRNSVFGKVKVSPARGVCIWCLAGSICHMSKASSDCSSAMDLVSRKFSLSNCCLLGTCYFLICMEICLFIYLFLVFTAAVQSCQSLIPAGQQVLCCPSSSFPYHPWQVRAGELS